MSFVNTVVRSSGGAIASALLIVFLNASLASAQGTVTGTASLDYYAAGTTPQTAELLKNVEQFHIGPGRDRMKRKSYQGALEDFEFILNYFPNHPTALSLVSDLCDVRWKSPRCDSSLLFEKALRINPYASQTHVLYGLHLQRRDAGDRAIDAYKRAIELNPASMNAHYNLGFAYLDGKRFDLANFHAQAAYMLGYPLPGLRDKLTRAGRWKPLPADEIQKAISPVDACREGQILGGARGALAGGEGDGVTREAPYQRHAVDAVACGR